MDVRPEKACDAAAIRALTTAAFATARHASGTEATIVDALRAAGALTLSLVAVEDERIVGHVALSPVTVDGRDCGWFGLGPVSVTPTRQRSGIGSHLITTALARLRADGAAGCVLLGEPRYYARFGFVADPRLRYPGAPARYFQALAFGCDVPTGEVSYHTGFGAV